MGSHRKQTHVATAQDQDHYASGTWPPNWPACVFHCWRGSSTRGEEKGGNSAGGALFWNCSHLHNCPVLVSQSVPATTHQHPPYVKEQLCFQSITSLVSLLHQIPPEGFNFSNLNFFTHLRRTFAPSTPDRTWFSLYIEAVSLLDEASSSIPTHATTETRVKVMHLDAEHTYQMVLQQASTRSYTFLSSPFPWH